MRTETARIAPVGERRYEADKKIRKAIETFGAGKPVPNLLAVLGTTPDALDRLAPWMIYLFREQVVLDPRIREIASLRIGWLCRCGYQFAQHVRIGLHTGLREEDIARVKLGPKAEGWSECERLVLRACDEAVESHTVGNATWHDLGRHLTGAEIMHLVYTIGQFIFICALLNSFGVQLDPGLRPDLDLAPPGGVPG